MNDFNKIRADYQILTPLIKAKSEESVRRWVDPYTFCDWKDTFTPIEENMWAEIRTFGKAPLYPQYPVDRYFTDFGNPVTKVAIECDGKEWHKDKRKDYLRDLFFAEEGWIVYRICGADCMKAASNEWYNIRDYDTDKQRLIAKDFYLTTAIGLVQAIAIFHYGWQPFHNDFDEIEIAALCLKERIAVKRLYYETTLDIVMNKFYSQR